MSQYVPKPFETFGGDISVKVDLSNYATKTDLEKVTVIDTSQLATKSDLVSLTAEVDKLDIDDKLVPLSVDLSNLSDVVKMMLLKTVCDNLVDIVNNIDTSRLVKKTDYNAKLSEIESKIPSIRGLPTTSVLTEIENKIPICNLVKRKQIMIQKLGKLKIKFLIIIMINVLLLQNSISIQQKFLMED